MSSKSVSQPTLARLMPTDRSLFKCSASMWCSAFTRSPGGSPPPPLPRKKQASRKNCVHSMVHSLGPRPSYLSCFHLGPTMTLSASESGPHCFYGLHFISWCHLSMCISCCHQIHGKSIFRKGGISGLQFKAGYSPSWWMAEGTGGFWSHHAYSQQRKTDRKWGQVRKLQGLSQRPISSSETLPPKDSVTSSNSAMSWEQGVKYVSLGGTFHAPTTILDS